MLFPLKRYSLIYDNKELKLYQNYIMFRPKLINFLLIKKKMFGRKNQGIVNFMEDKALFK